jgi:CHAT domain-containing protein/tetratricopeptide (TPR) repeat protein
LQQRRCLRWLGYSLYRLGRAQEAVQCWERLLDLTRAAADTELEAWARSGLALVHEEAGWPRRALEEYQQALALFRARDDARGAAYVQNGMGTALQALGRFDDAIDMYTQAAEAAHGFPWPWLEALAQNNIAVLLFSLGDPGQARDMFERAAELHRTAGDAAEAALAGVNVAKCEAALGRFEEAAARVEGIREECRRLGIRQFAGSLCNTLAGIRYEQGREHLAVRLHRETLAAETQADAQERVEALVALSQELGGMDSIPAALLLLRQASSWVEELETPGLRLAFRIELGRQCVEGGCPQEAWPLLVGAARTAERLGLGGLRLPALAWAARAARACGWPDSALALLRAATAVWEAERGLPVDPEWREQRGLTATAVRQQLGSLLLEYPTDLSATERARAAFDAVQVFKARTLLERMTGPVGGEAPALAFAPATCTQMQREVLRPGELLLDYHLGVEESLVFAVTSTECRAARLPGSTTFADGLALYTRMVSSPAQGPLDAADETRDRMRDLLLDPVESLLAGSRSLIVVPDGILHRVSFAALLADQPAANGKPASDQPPLIQVVPSATVFAKLRCRVPQDTAAGEGRGTLLALAGNPATAQRPLTGVRGEVRDLTARLHSVTCGLPGADRLSRRDSLEAPSPSAVLSVISGYEVLHLASHAMIEEEHPWRSRIYVGSAASPGGVVLTAADIAGARLGARLAVLSSCRSAGGRLLSGEGVQGLAGAFLAAGVPAVVATLWPVDDGSTRLFMRGFYDYLASGVPIAEALALAQTDLRRNPALGAPPHWAGFVVIGDGALTVPLERKSPFRRLIGPLALVALGVMAVSSLPLARYIRHQL